MGKLNWGKRAYAVVLLGATTAIALPAQTLTTLHSLGHNAGPSALVQATDGNFYGTSDGTVFKITPRGALTTLHSFCSVVKDGFCAEAGNPYAGLVQARDGNLYGTAGGGASGRGTVLKITPSGKLTTLHSFDGTDGNGPVAALVQATDGNFYGTTPGGGVHGDHGTIFKITPTGTLTTLYSFCSQSGCTDGASPGAALVQATDGNFYGTTSGGGVNTTHCSGLWPYGVAVWAVDFGCGTVFKITPGGKLTMLYSFCSQSGCADGANPASGLVQATDGNFYGTTQYGGAKGEGGTVFKITPSGTLTTLYSFCSQRGCTDGYVPFAGLVQATDGNLYGTTTAGGANSDGTVFSLSVGLGPFVKTLPTSREVGGAVEILGTNLTGATSVSFNGTAAVFKVVSSSFMMTTVPAGATTGTVQVVKPKRTLSSNVPFRVLP